MARHGLLKRLVGDLCYVDSSPFAKLLDSCVRSKSARNTRLVHARIIKSTFSSEIFIQNRLIDVYGKCACLDYARKVFERMPDRNIFSGNSIICALNKSGFLDEAVQIFGLLPETDQCTWNSLVSGFAQHDRFEEALEYFAKMHGENFILNEYSFGSALSACSGLRDFTLGMQIHALISKSRYSLDVFMGSALIDMYSKCGSVTRAQRVFDCMDERNIVSWNCLISCYEQNGPASEALEVFVRMMDCGFEPDEVTLASVISACASLLAINEGQQIHARVVKCDKYREDLVLGNALVDMYAKSNRVNEARCVFDRMPIRNVVSETSMVRYTQIGENEEAVSLFLLLKRESVWPTHFTFGNLLNACANMADLQLGKQAHTHVLKHGFRFQSGEESDIFVGNSLIDMYMKCGSIDEGCQVFENMLERDRVSWNAMIVGYAQNGYGVEALGLFNKMLVSGEQPDHVTMIGVLCGCSHAGLVEQGRRYFLSMTSEHNLVPMKDHYTCMVDLLGRAGCLDEAKNLIEKMPMQPDAVVWGSFLAACKIHRNITLGKYAAEKLLEMDPTNSGPYVLLSNMYAELGRWGEVVKVRKLMRQRGVIKQPGCSWIEVKGHVHVFLVKDKRHPSRKQIYSLLKSLLKQMKQAGYVPDSSIDEPCEELSDSEFHIMDMPQEIATG
ncbi:hypothetical protein UlMin_037673 [Ulmus minor]